MTKYFQCYNYFIPLSISYTLTYIHHVYIYLYLVSGMFPPIGKGNACHPLEN